MKLNWAQPLIGMDLEECYIVFLPGPVRPPTYLHLRHSVYQIQGNFLHFSHWIRPCPAPLDWTGEQDRKDGAIVSEYNPTNKSDELKIDRK